MHMVRTLFCCVLFLLSVDYLHGYITVLPTVNETWKIWVKNQHHSTNPPESFCLTKTKQSTTKLNVRFNSLSPGRFEWKFT